MLFYSHFTFDAGKIKDDNFHLLSLFQGSMLSSRTIKLFNTNSIDKNKLNEIIKNMSMKKLTNIQIIELKTDNSNLY